MYNMYGCLCLLALLIIPSALQQQPETVDQKLVKLGGWLERWRDQTLDGHDEHKVALNNVVAEAVGVRAQLQELLVDFAELVKTAQVIQEATSQLLLQCNSTQLLIDLQILKGRQAVGGAVQGGQVFMFVVYLVTIAVLYLVKHCKEHQQEAARTEFELLEAKLQANRSNCRAAAARAGKQSPQ